MASGTILLLALAGTLVLAPGWSRVMDRWVLLQLTVPSDADDELRAEIRRWVSIGSAIPRHRVLAFVERLFCCTSIAIGAPIGIAAWMAFKVAAKWAAWEHIVRAPVCLDSDQCSILTAFRARYAFASIELSRFLTGTLINVLFGVVAGAIIFSVVDTLPLFRM